MSIVLEQYKSGHYEQGAGYKYFVPSLINDQWLWNDPVINHLLEKASFKLGELNSFSRLVPDLNLFLQIHIATESVTSSRIEGTQTNIEDIFISEEEIKPEYKNDWREVYNYFIAMNKAIKQLEKIPVSSRLLCTAHSILLQGVRGKSQLPGEFRRSQNWIGGVSLNDAVFIPPHHQYIPQLMSDLEKFLHNNAIQVPDLVRIAIAHYQFETIHPFLDGNGRIGRLMITLYMVNKEILDKPLLYLSAFFEKNKNLYYENLTRVRTHNDMKQWIKYFLTGVERTAERGVNTLQKIIMLKQNIEQTIISDFGKRAQKANALLRHLFTRPVTSPAQAMKKLNCTFKTANDLINMMQERKWLSEMTGQQRNRKFVFKPYIEIFKNER